MSKACVALLIAAPASGQGKTSVTAALARLHARRGRRVRVFKCGPDFLDPQWLALASGQPVDNLDLWMNGEADVRLRLARAAEHNDLILIEGVMGLFDGEPSAAELARRLGVPVLAVVDAGAMVGTFGALVHGLRHYQPGLPWAGVLANRVAGDGHAQMLRDALRAGDGPWWGALVRDERMALPERHLGLTQAGELPDARARLDTLADALAATPLGQLAWPEWQRWAVTFEPPAPAPALARGLAGRRVALAQDAALGFVYPANLETLRELGADVVVFSPLADEPVPEADAVWLPGGYPELHAARLAAAQRTRASLARHVQLGRPVWAECGGMMVLFDGLTLADGQRVPMWGLLPGEVRMQPRLAALGPQAWRTPWGELRGHTFHYSTVDTPLTPVARTAPARPHGRPEAVWRHGPMVASYFHAWFASAPAAVAQLFRGALA
ncbi:hydrogenobyrinic acid a,c-diamide synthase (glutamine-hydrolysing) /cobyrinate a,c-diamide synthase [Tepidimonas ignava]|uniref:Hydrogenobyrinate a,c-diamide synthase n=1 Tax=Tepidimonas ignava TaxID=114249 RepID=A0A4V2UWK1_9BURK|nr:cobyrinate a,c-diamide synthase [Tepidimonas ignava]TCS99927.1 hydrogenobyrinic acid a,c-diamide synthase (glutamine-hydrolysing) /cobyrinate a,c-diamide synthase [Tepidimonas ignava]TSE23312.1 Hydrogenobyrinate a,c-diamide synthase [Tepidimonas ignava]